MSRIAAEVIRDADVLSELLPEWWTLWRSVPQTTVFQSPAWVLPWWDVFQPGRLCSIAVHDGERLVGLAAIYLATGPLGERLLPIGIGISDYCDVLLAPDCIELAAGAMASALSDIGDWKICEFAELLAGACAYAIPPPPNATVESLDASVAPVLRLPAGAELSDVVPRVRWRNIRRARAAAAKAGITVHRAGMPYVRQAIADLVRLHSARWAIDGQGGVFADTRVVDFHYRAAPRLATEGIARIDVLSISGRVAAVHYGFSHRHAVYAYLQGYDPEFSDHSPGTLLLAHAIDEAIMSGANEFHFLRGDEPYKFSWGAQPVRNRTLVVSRHNRNG